MTKKELLDNLKGLGFSVENISTRTGIPKPRIYKWYAGMGLPKLEDYNKLIELYETLKPSPTNDFITGVNEPTVLYEKLLKSKDDQIALLNKRIEELEDKYKPPLQLGKTGGRRN